MKTIILICTAAVVSFLGTACTVVEKEPTVHSTTTTTEAHLVHPVAGATTTETKTVRY